MAKPNYSSDYWQGQGIYVQPIPETVKLSAYTSQMDIENASGADIDQLVKLAESCGFRYAGAAATIPSNANSGTYLLAIEALRETDVFGPNDKLNFTALFVNGNNNANAVNVGRTMAGLKEGTLPEEQRLRKFIQDLWGQQNAAGNNQPLSDIEADYKIPGMLEAREGIAEKALADAGIEFVNDKRPKKTTRKR